MSWVDKWWQHTCTIAGNYDFCTVLKLGTHNEETISIILNWSIVRCSLMKWGAQWTMYSPVLQRHFFESTPHNWLDWREVGWWVSPTSVEGIGIAISRCEMHCNRVLFGQYRILVVSCCQRPQNPAHKVWETIWIICAQTYVLRESYFLVLGPNGPFFLFVFFFSAGRQGLFGPLSLEEGPFGPSSCWRDHYWKEWIDWVWRAGAPR